MTAKILAEKKTPRVSVLVEFDRKMKHVATVVQDRPRRGSQRRGADRKSPGRASPHRSSRRTWLSPWA